MCSFLRLSLQEMLARLRDESCTVIDDKNKFGVQLDVRQFKPEEVDVSSRFPELNTQCLNVTVCR